MIGDKIQQTITSRGTGTLSLNSAGAVAGWKTWRSSPYILTGRPVLYYFESDDGSIWEYGYGTFTQGSPDTITRNLILSSTGALIDMQDSDAPFYSMSVPMGLTFQGRFNASAGANGTFVLHDRKDYTAVGAANKTSAVTYQDDIAGRFSLDNSAAIRTYTLPAISNVSVGWSVEIVGLSQLFVLNLAPTGSDVIDYLSGGTTLSLPGKTLVRIWSDGTQWRTNLDYSSWHTLLVANPSGASSVDFTSIPANVKGLHLFGDLVPATDAANIAMQTYGADGVKDTGGSDYAYAWAGANTNGVAANASNAAGSMLLASSADNGSCGVGFNLFAHNIQAATHTKFESQVGYLDSAGTIWTEFSGAVRRLEADRITGLSVFPSSGNFTGFVGLNVLYG